MPGQSVLLEGLHTVMTVQQPAVMKASSPSSLRGFGQMPAKSKQQQTPSPV